MIGSPDFDHTHRTYASERLRYEELRIDHAMVLASALTDPRVNAHFIQNGPRNEAELADDFARKIEGPGGRFPGETWLNFTVRLTDEDSYIGRVEAAIQGENAEIAYLIGPAFWNRGLGQEAARWIERFCAQEHGVRTFWATVAPSNHQSLRLLSRLGYARVDKPPRPLLTSYDEGDLVFRRSWAYTTGG